MGHMFLQGARFASHREQAYINGIIHPKTSWQQHSVSLEEYICILKSSSPGKILQHLSNNSLFPEQSTTYLCKIINSGTQYMYKRPSVLLFSLLVSIRMRLVLLYTMYTNVHHTNNCYNTEYIARFS